METEERTQEHGKNPFLAGDRVSYRPTGNMYRVLRVRGDVIVLAGLGTTQAIISDNHWHYKLEHRSTNHE